MFRSFLAGITVGSVTALLALQYHLVRTDDGLVIIPRVHQPPVRSAYVDTRSWTLDMWKNYPEVTEAVILSGRSNLIVDRATRRIQEQPDVVSPIEANSLRQGREAIESLLNVNRPGTQPRSGDLQLDPPPPRRMPDQKRPAVISPMAAADRPIGELRAGAPPEHLNSENRMVPVPSNPAAPVPVIDKHPAADPAPGKSFLMNIFKSTMLNEAPPAKAAIPLPLRPQQGMAKRPADETWFESAAAPADAGPPLPRQLLQLPPENTVLR